jgi:hypothetical protein
VVTADLGKGLARAGDAVPRQRGGAHAAAKTSRFRRKSASAAPASAPSAPPALSHPRHLQNSPHLPYLRQPRQFLPPPHLCHRGARRAGDGGRALDADRGRPRRSGRTGSGLHRKARDRRQTHSGPEPGPAIAPGADRERSRAARRSPGRVTRSIMGKLATVANRIVDRGELCVCPVKERRCQSTLSS